MKKRKKRKLSFFATAFAFITIFMLAFTACGSADSGNSGEVVGGEDDVGYTTAEFVSYDVADVVGWWYRPEDLEGIPIISIFEIKEDGTFTAYDAMKNVDLEGTIAVAGDTITMNIPDWGPIKMYYQDNAFYYYEDDSIGFERGEELQATDNSYLYGTWYQGADTSANSLTLYEDGTYDEYDAYTDSHTTGNYELDYQINMINGMDMMEGEEVSYIRLGTADDFFPTEYYIMPSGNTIYLDDSWGGASLYAKEGIDPYYYDYDAKLLSLTENENNWSNDNYSLTFYKNGYFSIDSITQDENSYSSSYYMHGYYTPNEDFTSVYLSFDDGSFDGDCPIDLENSTLYVEPLGDLT